MRPVDITIADVAQRAGVSVSTVSRILNNKPDVAESTRVRVQNIIDELDFKPHTQAQRLAAGSSRTIAFLHPIEYLFADRTHAETDFILGASFAAAEESYMFNLVTVPVTEGSLLGLYRSAQVDGIILMEIHLEDWRVALLRGADRPFTMIGHCTDNTGLTYIDLDFEAGVHVAIDHLVDLGHRRIGFLTHSAVVREHLYGPAVRSLRGYKAACKKHSLDICYQESDADVDALRDSTNLLLDQFPGLTAIVATGGAAIVGPLSALKARGLRVPEDMSIICFMSPRYGELISPKLTAVNLPGYEMGYKGAKMLIANLQYPNRKPEQVLLPPTLIVRESTAPPRSYPN